MSANAMSLKAQIKNLAKKKNIKAQVLLQNYMLRHIYPEYDADLRSDALKRSCIGNRRPSRYDRADF